MRQTVPVRDGGTMREKRDVQEPDMNRNPEGLKRQKCGGWGAEAWPPV